MVTSTQTFAQNSSPGAQATLLTAAGASANGADVVWPGGWGEFRVWGNLSGGTVTLQRKLPAGSILGYGACGPETSMSAEGVVQFYAISGAIIRAVTGVGVTSANADVTLI